MRIALVRWSMLGLFVVATGAWTQTPATKTPAAAPKTEGAAPKMQGAAPKTMGAQTATEFYMAYRVAFDKATKIEDLFPYVTADMKKKVEATPAAERPKMFGMMKMMGTYTGVKISKEDKNADGSVTLTAEAIDSDKKKESGKITIVKEGGAWKLGNEEWH